EAELLCEHAVAEQVVRSELFRRRFPAQPHHVADGTEGTAMSIGRLVITAVHGLPEVRPGDDLARPIADAVRAQGDEPRGGDILAVAQKIVSKSEGRIVRLADVTPGPRAKEMAAEAGKDPRQLEVVLSETAKIVRWSHGVLISETRHGFI